MPNESDGAAAGELALHPATLPILAAGRTAITKRARAQTPLDQEDQKEARKPSPERDFDWNAMRWGEFARERPFLSKWHEDAPRVSDTGLSKALVTLSVLCRQAESNGFAVAARPVKGRISIDLDGEPLLVSIREQFVDGEIPRVFRDERAVSTKVGTGRFVLVIEGAGSSTFEVRDDDRGSIASKIQEGIFARLRQRRAASDAWDKHREKGWEEQARIRAEQEEEQRLQRAERQEADAERKRREALVDQASRWDRAQLVRAYAEHVATKAGSDPSPELQKWIVWARRVANDLEPPMPAAPSKDPN